MDKSEGLSIVHVKSIQSRNGIFDELKDENMSFCYCLWVVKMVFSSQKQLTKRSRGRQQEETTREGVYKVKSVLTTGVVQQDYVIQTNVAPLFIRDGSFKYDLQRAKKEVNVNNIKDNCPCAMCLK